MPATAAAQAGALDPRFGGGDGKVVTRFTRGSDVLVDIALQPDGKVIAAGVFNHFGRTPSRGDFAVARYDATGRLDYTFGYRGRARTGVRRRTEDEAVGAALLADGKVLVGGSSLYPSSMWGRRDRLAVVRYMPDGRLDLSYGRNGKALFARRRGGVQVSAFAADSRGRAILAARAGATNNLLVFVRFTADGRLDTSFSRDGRASVRLGWLANVADVVVQPDDKILVVGPASVRTARDSFFMLRFTEDGELDPTFGGDGLIVSAAESSLAPSSALVQPDRRIVLAGTTRHELRRECEGWCARPAVARYAADGSLDPTFADGGTAILDVFVNTSVEVETALQSDGKIVLAATAARGFVTDFAVMRLTAEGPPDPTFDGDGVATVDMATNRHDLDAVTAVAVRPSGEVVVGGHVAKWYFAGRSTYIYNFGLAQFLGA